MNFKRLLLGLFFLLYSLSTFAAYDVVKRLKLHEDRFKTQEMLRPLGHDFLIDISAYANKNATDFMDDIEKVSKTQGTTTDKITAGTTTLNKYVNTEQTVRAAFNLGVPIFSFSAFGFKIVPDLRINFGLTLNMGIRSEPFTLAMLAEFLPSNMDPAIKSKASQINTSAPSFSAGKDIVQIMIDQNLITQAQGTPFLGKYYVPTEFGVASSAQVPNASIFAKADLGAGTKINYSYDEHWFGHFSLYGLGRADYLARFTSDSLARDGDAVNFDDPNTQVNLTADYQIGYKNANYWAAATIEEIKLGKLSDKVEETGKSVYGTDPLLRLHAQADYRFWILKVSPFLGAHQRNGYGFGDAYYLGADWGGYVWGDRLGMQLRTQYDKEHITISPRLKLWFMQLEYMLKTPSTSTIDDVKVATIHSLNFRLFF